MANGHGGARPGAGRKPSADRKPKAAKEPKRAEPSKPSLPAVPAEPVKRASFPHVRRSLVEQFAALLKKPSDEPKIPFDGDPFLLARPHVKIGDRQSRIALDESIQDVISFAGTLGLTGSWEDGLAFPGFTYLAYLQQRPEYRKITERLATEMTREWIEFEAVGEKGTLELGQREDRIKVIEDELERLSVRSTTKAVLCNDGFFGRGHYWLDFGESEGDEIATPIGDGRSAVSKAKVSPDKPLKRITSVEPMWAYPTQFNGINPLKPDWYNPEHWFVMSQRVHRSRLLTVVGRPLPDILKPTYAFAGMSRSQMAKRYIDNWVRTQRSVGDMVSAFSTMIWSTDLSTLLQPQAGETSLIERVQLYNAFRDNRGTFLVDKQTEDVKNVAAPLGGLSELQAQAQEQMASVSNMPLVILLGITPTGLNASSEGEIRSFFDFVRAEQEDEVRPPLTKIVDFVQLSKFGAIDQGIRFKFKPLWALDEKGQAEVDKIRMETDTGYVEGGILGEEEVRTAIASRVSSPYKGIDPEDVPEVQPGEEGELEPGGGEGGPGETCEQGEGGGGNDDDDARGEGRGDPFGKPAQDDARPVRPGGGKADFTPAALKLERKKAAARVGADANVRSKAKAKVAK